MANPAPKLDRISRCPCCVHAPLRAFHEVSNIPVHSTLNMTSHAAATSYPRGDLRLGFCATCGFVCNTLFDPAVHEYSTRCEESQGASETFNAFARSLARRWAEQYHLAGKTVLEIGCGKGEFLEMMVRDGGVRGIGIDPGYQPQRTDPALAGRLSFIQDFYSERYASIPADCVVCRHTLEHISPTGDFLRMIRRVIGGRKDVIVLFELPDVLRVLRECAFWDIYYEHCSYFSAGSLARLFRAAHFDVLELQRVYGDQYLLIAARPTDGPTAPALPLEDDLAEVSAEVAGFAGQIDATLAGWGDRVKTANAAGRKVVLWGSLSKGVSFLTTLGLVDEVPAVVDINPHRQGKFMLGTGQPIIAPAALKDIRPDYAIVMNPIYCAEIRRELDRLGLRQTALWPVGVDGPPARGAT